MKSKKKSGKKKRSGVRKKFTKKQLALIRRVLNLKGLPPALRQMLLVLVGVSMKPHARKKPAGKKSPAGKHKKRRATAKQLAVRRKFKAFIRKHHRRPRKGEHL